MYSLCQYACLKGNVFESVSVRAYLTVQPLERKTKIQYEPRMRGEGEALYECINLVSLAVLFYYVSLCGMIVLPRITPSSLFRGSVDLGLVSAQIGL